MKKYGILLSCLFLAHNIEPHTIFGIDLNFYPFNVHTSQEIARTTLLSVAAVLLATKLGYDLSWHTTYTQNAHYWYYLLENTVSANNITSVSDARLKSLFSPVDHDDIMQLHKWLNNSYNCWLTPWNWTASQQESFQKLQVIEILTLYSDLIALQDQINGKEILKFCRNKYATMSFYPLIFGYSLIDQHLHFIARTKYNKLSGLLADMTNYLQNFKLLLRQEKEYQLEIQTKYTHDLQKELINATNNSGYRR